MLAYIQLKTGGGAIQLCAPWYFPGPADRPSRAKNDLPIPITTKNPVQNRPKSTIALLPLSTKSSGFEHCPQIQFGKGASTKVATTSSGWYLWKSAQERITRRNPIART